MSEIVGDVDPKRCGVRKRSEFRHMVSDVARSNLDDPDTGVCGAAEMCPSASVDAVDLRMSTG